MASSKARFRRLVLLQEARPDLPLRTLFHAGPPYRRGRPEAVTNAAAQAAVIAGWANDVPEARSLLETDDLSLAPAQDHGIAVPLAMVVAPTMWCLEVGEGSNVFHSPMSEGPPPALRFGSDSPECIKRARDWCSQAAAIINPRLARLPPVEELTNAALVRGDECHAITAAGNLLFVDALGDIPEPLRNDLLGNPGFALGIWMAWAGWKLRSSGSLIEAIGGNGLDFGWRPRGAKAWLTVPAPSPSGSIFKKDRVEFCLGAIGDSALIDICGLGGQSLRFAPNLIKEWADVLPDDVRTRHQRILDVDTGIVDVSQVIEMDTGPIINLAIVDREGAAAPIGRGVYVVPPGLFKTGS
ncbi:MAG: hypothetical protein JWQ07_5396 [Ramlibacter sp.]|nr:hypothetical protein [Ramlibacter sp.]